jgi:dipeptidyl aminopeptidase/acylaminoacyl peptidase
VKLIGLVIRIIGLQLGGFMFKRIITMITFFVVLMASVAVPVKAEDTKAKSDAFVKVPETIINENVPPIPMAIKQKLKQYSELKSAGIVDLDPRGKGMIVSTRLGDTAQLYWLSTPKGKLKQLTDYKEPVGGATFSPDPAKKYFLFSKDVGGAENYQIFMYRLDTGKTEMISSGKHRYMGMTFNEKGDKIAYASNARTGKFFDVYIMDPEKKNEKLVLQAPKPAYYVPVGWLPDNRHLLVVEYISANKANTLMVDTESGEIKNLTPKSDKPQFFVLGGASKDGKYLFGITDRDGEAKRLIRFELATEKIDVITKDISWNISNNLNVTKDKSKMVFSVNEGGLNKIYIMDMKTLKYKLVQNLPEGLLGGLIFDAAGKSLFVNINNARMNSDAFQLDLESGKLVRWTQSDSGGLDLDNFVIPKLIHYPTFDKVAGEARKIPAFYYRPTKKTSKPYPVLINIHGGPESQYRPRFQGTTNYLINELGIAVIAPNVRGSNGYGKSYLMMDNWEKREDSVKDIGALLDWIATRPELDKNRVAVYGGSYGGYMVLASMIQYGDRLACGVDIVGISNFVTFLKNTSAYRRDLRRVEYGDERKIGEFLTKISPTTNAHKIKKPLFVIQGKNDPRVPESEASQIVATVKKNNVPVWYQLATNEGHGFRKKYNRDFMTYSVIRFYQEYLLK